MTTEERLAVYQSLQPGTCFSCNGRNGMVLRVTGRCMKGDDEDTWEVVLTNGEYFDFDIYSMHEFRDIEITSQPSRYKELRCKWVRA